MNTLRYAGCLSLVWGALFATSLVSPVAAQHSDVFVYQQNGLLVPTDGATQQVVFSRLFDFFGHPFGNTGLPKAFVANDPGFQTNRLSPSGMGELPAGGTLFGNFLPFQIPGNVSGNILHWDPTAGPIDFQPVNSGHFFEITDAANQSGLVLDGGQNSLDNVLLGLVNTANEIHEHIDFRLDDGDGNNATDPAAGVYLMMLQMNMDGIGASDPFAILLNSTDITVAEQSAARNWVETQIDSFTILGESLTGDFDSNGLFDVLDIDQLVAAVASANSDGEFDMNGDGAVNYDDVTSWLDIAATANPSAAAYYVGDANLDGLVDVTDFNTWNVNNTTLGGAWSRADFNADGTVNNSDFDLLNGNLFRTPGAAQFVPEPDMRWLIYLFTLAALFTVRTTRSEVTP